jgi:hypothetical protein
MERKPSSLDRGVGGWGWSVASPRQRRMTNVTASRTRPASSPGRAASLRSRPVRATKATWRFRTRADLWVPGTKTLNEARSVTLPSEWSPFSSNKSNNGLSRAQFVVKLRASAITRGYWVSLSPLHVTKAFRASRVWSQAGHASSIPVVVLRPPAVAWRLRCLTVASLRPVERSCPAACPNALATAPRLPH